MEVYSTSVPTHFMLGERALALVGLGEPHSWSLYYAEEKNLLLLPGIEYMAVCQH
jgi:hypothetical protein